MATIALTAQAPFKAAGSFFALLSKTVSIVVAWNENRKDHRVLSQLSDAQLDDIGLTRADF